MNLAVDSSAILRQLLSRQAPRLLLDPRLRLFVPEHVQEETARNLGRRAQAMVNQGRLEDSEAHALTMSGGAVKATALIVVPAPVYAAKEAEARRRLELHCRDSGWPDVALTLLLGSYCQEIWAEDRDYWGCGCAVWSTEVLRRVLSEEAST